MSGATKKMNSKRQKKEQVKDRRAENMKAFKGKSMPKDKTIMINKGKLDKPKDVKQLTKDSQMAIKKKQLTTKHTWPEIASSKSTTS
jgi:hypothetical protein